MQIYFIDNETIKKLDNIIEQFKEYANNYSIITGEFLDKEAMFRNSSDPLAPTQSFIAHANARYYEGQVEAFRLCIWALENFIKIYKAGDNNEKD